MHEITKKKLEETQTKLVEEQKRIDKLTVEIKNQEEKKKQLSEDIAEKVITIENLKGSNEKWENSFKTAKSEMATVKADNDKITSELSETKLELTKSQIDDAANKQVIEDLQQKIDGLNKTITSKDISNQNSQDSPPSTNMQTEQATSSPGKISTELVVNDIQDQNSQANSPPPDTQTDQPTSSPSNLIVESVVDDIQDQDPQNSPPSTDTVTNSSNDLSTKSVANDIQDQNPQDSPPSTDAVTNSPDDPSTTTASDIAPTDSTVSGDEKYTCTFCNQNVPTNIKEKHSFECEKRVEKQSNERHSQSLEASGDSEMPQQHLAEVQGSDVKDTAPASGSRTTVPGRKKSKQKRRKN
jgi:hypothetical protein